MSSNNIFSKIYRKIKGFDSAKAEIDYLIKNGLGLGKHVSNYSPYAFDSEYPWLISVGDNL